MIFDDVLKTRNTSQLTWNSMCLKTENDNNDSDKKNDSQKKNVFAFNLHFGFIYDFYFVI